MSEAGSPEPWLCPALSGQEPRAWQCGHQLESLPQHLALNSGSCWSSEVTDKDVQLGHFLLLLMTGKGVWCILVCPLTLADKGEVSRSIWSSVMYIGCIRAGIASQLEGTLSWDKGML